MVYLEKCNIIGENKMIKRVIFDIDNTLIPWRDEYFNEIFEALKELKIECSNDDFNKIKKSLSEYENVYYSFNKDNMIKYINEYTGKNYPEEFINKVISKWANCVPENLPEDTIKTLKYLSDKYEMVCLTDWYKDQQVQRLEKVDILKYFQEVCAAENIKRKPFKEAFMQAIGVNKPEECIMIGDNFERDAEGALKAGLQAIYYNPKKNETKKEKQKYYEISKLIELTNIL